jgi:hypothetical protein
LRNQPLQSRTLIALGHRPAELAGAFEKCILFSTSTTMDEAAKPRFGCRRGDNCLISTALERISVGVVVERRRGKSAWAGFLWRPVSVFAGSPSAEPWTPLDEKGEQTLFYAGQATIELYRTETTNYRDNLASGSPALWVNLRPTGSEPPYELLAVTADPAEGEAFTDAGSNLVEAVSMPSRIAEIVERFVIEHHVERPFIKRRRNRQERPA